MCFMTLLFCKYINLSLSYHLPPSFPFFFLEYFTDFFCFFWPHHEEWGILVPCMHVRVLSCFSPVWLFVTPLTVACEASLSMGFSRQEYWGGLPSPPPGDLPDQGVKPKSSAGCFFTHWATWETPLWYKYGVPASGSPGKSLISFLSFLHLANSN